MGQQNTTRAEREAAERADRKWGWLVLALLAVALLPLLLWVLAFSVALFRFVTDPLP